MVRYFCMGKSKGGGKGKQCPRKAIETASASRALWDLLVVFGRVTFLLAALVVVDMAVLNMNLI